MTDFKPYLGHNRKPGTGCISKINNHLFEGRYSPVWPDGKKHSRNVYAHTHEECEEKLKVLIVEMKEEIAAVKGSKKPDSSPDGISKSKKPLRPLCAPTRRSGRQPSYPIKSVLIGCTRRAGHA
ncbi:hypothetical protein [Oscillibacter sp.]|uniref:hypothetical protein n=1 Tax=Oscillibacter sp. TaxID=1945593 RepID=UPI003393AEFE